MHHEPRPSEKGHDRAPDVSVEALVEQWRTRGDATAIIQGPDAHHATFAALSRHLTTLLDHIGPDRHLLLVEATPTVSTVILCLAAWTGRHGIILCPPDDSLSQERLTRQFSPNWVAKAGDSGDAIARLMRAEPVDDRPAMHPMLAVLLPIGGRGSEVQAVRLSRHNLTAGAEAMRVGCDIAPDDRTLSLLPLDRAHGLAMLGSHLLAGATLVLDPRDPTDPALWASARKLGVTGVAGDAKSFDRLVEVDLAAQAPASLRRLIHADGHLPPERAARYATLARSRGWRFPVLYGRNEASGPMACLPLHHPDTDLETIGCPLPGGHLTLRDDAGQSVQGTDMVGELLYHGPGVLMGHATRREDLALPPQEPVLPTGDLARRLPSGSYRLVGHLGRTVRIVGRMIDLAGVEDRLARAGISAVVTGNDDQIFILVGPDAEGASIVSLLSEELGLPPARIAILCLSNAPRLATGEVDHQRLRLDFQERRPPAPMPHLDRHTPIRDIFVYMFGDAAQNDWASFRSLGGHSFLHATMAKALEERLGQLPDGWEATSIAALARRAEDAAVPALASPPLILSNLDTLRGIACLLVVAFHVVGLNSDTGMKLPMDSPWHGVVDSIRFIRMPLFTAMAGYLYALKPYLDLPRPTFIRRKARGLLIPAFFVGAVMWAIRAKMHIDQPSLLLALLVGSLHLWYLNALFVLFVVIALAERRGPMPLTLAAAMAVLGVGLVLPARTAEWLVIPNVLYLLPYFLLGMYLKRLPELLYNPLTVRAGAVISLAMLGLELYWRTGTAPVPSFEPFLTLIAGFAVVPPLLYYVPKVPLLAALKPYSMTIYLWHPLANGAVRAILQRLDIGLGATFVLCMIGAVLLPILLHKVVQKMPLISLPVIGR